MKQRHIRPPLKPLRTKDPKTAFHTLSPQEILDRYGHPKTLLGTSSKAEKCSTLGLPIVSRVMFLTPGLFCPLARGCLESCLGHSSGNMQLPGSTRARDSRAALYMTNPRAFINRLKGELRQAQVMAQRSNSTLAVRLNGSSDIDFALYHPELFEGEFSSIIYFDYTKVRSRMIRYLRGELPDNYSLTMSLDESNERDCREVLDLGGNVAAVFWPQLPSTYWGCSVIDGDVHDCRWTDGCDGMIVGLRAKAFARVDLTGFTRRPCPQGCDVDLQLCDQQEDTHRTIWHRCPSCRVEHRSRWILPHALAPMPPFEREIKQQQMELPTIIA